MINFQYRYPNLDENEFVPFSCDKPELIGVLEINKLGYFRKKNNPKKYPISYHGKYPRVFIKINGKEYSFTVHKCLAQTFIINPDPKKYTQVHHKDGNPLNFSLNNLEWITVKDHAKITRSSHSQYEPFIAFIKLDPVTLFEIERINKYDLSAHQRASIYRSIKNSSIYKGHLWKVVNSEVENYYNNFSIKERKGEIWKITSDPMVAVSNLGVVWRKDKLYPTLGTKLHISNDNLGNPIYYRYINLKDRGLVGIHVLVAENFLRPIISGEMVDHKNRNTELNSVTNLTVGSGRDNQMNPNTQRLRCKKIGCYDFYGKLIKIFSSVTEANLHNSGNSRGGNISKCALEKNLISAYGYLWAYQDGTQDEVIKRKLDLLAKKNEK